MKLTSFFKFRAAVTALGIPIIIAEIEDSLSRGDMDIKYEDIIQGENGLYGLIEREGHFFVTQIILHISDYSLHFLNRHKNAFVMFKDRKYNAPELIGALHKYHFHCCKTLDYMFEKKRNHRYKQSRRQDGKFHYQFIENNKVLVDQKEQKLNVCKNCLAWFNERLNMSEQVKTFRPSTFFENLDKTEWLPDCGYQSDTEATYAPYPDDFKKISKRIREKKGWRCENCGIDLSDKNLRHFLHAHHKNADKSNNHISNLSCLCIKCHAEQPMHERMQGKPDYKKFLPIWNRIAGAVGLSRHHGKLIGRERFENPRHL